MAAVFALTAGMTAGSLSGQDLDGTWRGAIRIQGVALEIVVTFTTADDTLGATIIIPQQTGTTAIPLTNVRHEGTTVHFELPSPLGQAIFDGTLDADSIAGSFVQAANQATFDLRREGEAPDTSATPPPPYGVEEVTFPSGDLTLAGTLTIPEGPGPHPAAVMITGSGAQNRDEELFGFKPFAIIADHLTRHGIAVLRYDDRGVGGSGGSVANSTTEDFADDVLAAVRLLRSRPDIASDHIGVIGHSEGGVVAPLAVVRDPGIAFQVLIAPPAIPSFEILRAQSTLIARAEGAGDEAIARQDTTLRQVRETLHSDTGWDTLRALVARQVRAGIEALPAERRSTIANVDSLVDAQVEAQLSQIRTPWFRAFIEYDPAPVLRQARAPLLALFGELDLQVPATLNRDAMERILSGSHHPDYTIKVFPHANHLFLTATTGSPSEYASLEKTFVPGFLDLITTWITKHVRPATPSGESRDTAGGFRPRL